MVPPTQEPRAVQSRRGPSAASSLEAWLSWLEAKRGEHIDLGLDRCRRVGARLKLDKPAPLVITVAGTNGKGSSVALLERIWQAAGYRTAAYTSPHLLRYNERMRVNGQPLGDQEICDAFAAVEDARENVALTYFEFATLAALHVFARMELDVVILEVGLGGRLDAVNIIDADVALIAAIGLDHEDWLGNMRDQIGREKAGIMRAGKPVVCSDHAVPASIPEAAAQCGASLRLLGVDFAYESSQDGWVWWSGDDVLADLPPPALDGAHQFRNAAGVLEVVRVLNDRLPVKPEDIHRGLSSVSLGGRFHRVIGRFEYVMDVAHNPQAAEIFVQTLTSMPHATRTHALIGMLNTKNHREFLRPLIGHVDSWHFADLPGTTGAAGEDLARSLCELDARAEVCCYNSVEQAHEGLVRMADAADRILVIGSCLTVGAMMRLLNSQTESNC